MNIFTFNTEEKGYSDCIVLYCNTQLTQYKFNFDFPLNIPGCLPSVGIAIVPWYPRRVFLIRTLLFLHTHHRCFPSMFATYVSLIHLYKPVLLTFRRIPLHISYVCGKYTQQCSPIMFCGSTSKAFASFFFCSRSSHSLTRASPFCAFIHLSFLLVSALQPSATAIYSGTYRLSTNIKQS